MSFVEIAGRIPESRLRDVVVWAAGQVDSVLTGKDDGALSRRMTVVTFVTRVMSAVIAYVSQVVLARWMGDFEYGIFVVVWVGIVLVGGLGCLGTQLAVLRFVPEYTERDQPELLRGIIRGSRIQGLVVSTFAMTIGLAGLYLFGAQLSSIYLIPLYLGAVTLPMLTVGEIQEGLARAFNWANLALWPTYIVRPLLIPVFMGVAIWFGWKPDAITAMGAVIAATYATAIGQFLTLEWRMAKVVPPGPHRYLPLTWIAIAVPMFVVEGFFNLLTNVDIIIVGHMMTPDKVAVYFAAAKTMALVHFVYYAVRTGSAQRFARYYVTGDTARLATFVRDTLHWTFWPSLAMVGLLALAGRPLLSLFGPSFVDGYSLLFILSLGLLVRASIGPAETLLIMAGQQRITAVVYTAAFFLNVSLNLFLIPRLGLAGAAAATTLALSAETLVLYVIVRNRLGLKCSIVEAMMPRPGALEAS